MARKARTTKANVGRNTDQITSDVLVAGAGYVGLSCAVAIKSAAAHLHVTIVDPAPLAAIENDERSSAIAPDATNMLSALGIWDELVAGAQPIKEMIVTDSKVSDIIRPVFLTFSEETQNGQPLAHMIENRNMIKALRNKADGLGVEMVAEDAVEDFSYHGTHNELQLRSGNIRKCRLLVACDGVRSKLRDLSGIKTVHWPYDQKGIVCTVSHERPHNGCAEEHFLPAGPFAILPLKGNRSSLVWTESTHEADQLVGADELIFEAELERRFGHKLGNISVDSKVQAYPLGLRLAREYVQPGFALAGDAAHGIHPIAGQGLNLGFKDAAALAETVVEADRLGLDIGALDVLERYQAWRRFDTVQMGVLTDVLNRLFSNDNSVVRKVRDIGLGLVDRMPLAKSFFANQATGKNPSAPRLLRGEAI